MTWPVTVVATGDLISAAQLNRLPVILAEHDGAGADYDFTSIPAWPGDLLLVGCVQTASGNNLDDLKIQFNGLTTANYHSQKVKGAAATASAAETIGGDHGRIGSVPGVSAGGFASFQLLIPNFAAVIIHTWQACCFAAYGVTTGLLEVTEYGGVHNVTAAAINRVRVFPGAGSFVTGSRVQLLGLGTT